MTDSDTPTSTVPGTRRLARVVLLVFLLTFVLSRVIVFLIMDHLLPDLYVHLGGTHVHHLNYGIFLLVGTGAWLLFSPPQGRQRIVCAVLYAIGLALTFDEFGMWLHLGGGYWQRASFDAVIVLLSLFGVIAFAPSLARMRTHHWATAVITALAVVLFYLMLFESIRYVENRVGTRLIDIEEAGPR